VVPVGELDTTAVAERVAATTSLCSDASIVWTQHHNIEEEANRPTLWSSTLSDTTYDEIMTTTVVNQVTPTLLIQAATKIMAQHAGTGLPPGKRQRSQKEPLARLKKKPFDAPVARVSSFDSDGEEESKVSGPQSFATTAHVPALTPSERLELILSQYPKPVPSFSRMNVIVNVTSTEHLHTTPQHAVTGMQKAAMENLIEKVAFTRQPDLYVYNADPGFVTGVYGGPTKPLSSIDGGARVVHPLIQAALGRGHGQTCILFKDYAVKKRLDGSSFGSQRPKAS
jgi:NAD(P)-dependent dehydrogenase (short-subunit alcohol dehydrogenase family)